MPCRVRIGCFNSKTGVLCLISPQICFHLKICSLQFLVVKFNSLCLLFGHCQCNVCFSLDLFCFQPVPCGFCSCKRNLNLCCCRRRIICAAAVFPCLLQITFQRYLFQSCIVQ